MRTTAAQFGHQTRADATRKLYIFLGVPVVALTTLVGTSVFATFNKTPSQLAKLFVGAISILAAPPGPAAPALVSPQLQDMTSISSLCVLSCDWPGIS